jgi:hypothetical protein
MQFHRLDFDPIDEVQAIDKVLAGHANNHVAPGMELDARRFVVNDLDHDVSDAKFPQRSHPGSAVQYYVLAPHVHYGRRVFQDTVAAETLDKPLNPSRIHHLVAKQIL